MLVDRTSARIIAMIGCIGSGLSLGLASFTTDISVLFVAYGALTGK